jgi:hypothetical protein
MTPSEQYRTLAANCARARSADSEELAAEWEHLTNCYVPISFQPMKFVPSNICNVPSLTDAGATALVAS